VDNLFSKSWNEKESHSQSMLLSTQSQIINIDDGENSLISARQLLQEDRDPIGLDDSLYL